MDLPATSQIDSTARPAVVSEHALPSETWRRRGAVLPTEALADWPLLLPAGRGLSISGLAGTLVTLDGLRLTPGPGGRFDLTVLPIALIDTARVSAGPAGVAQGSGALAGVVDLTLAPVAAGGRLWSMAGVQADRGIAGLDVRAGGANGWLAAGFTQGGALPAAGGLAASEQGRWHLAGRFSQDLGAAQLWGRALLATRRDGGERADHHDLALGVAGGERWQWRLAVASGGQQQPDGSSRLAQARAVVSGATGLVLPGATEPISLAAGAESRRLRVEAGTIHARELFAEAAVPLLQDRPAAENLVATVGLRQAWLAGRSELLWQAGGRWEFFPGIALRGQMARGVDDLASRTGTGRSLGLIATPAFLPGLAFTLDWRRQTAAASEVKALDVAANWRGRLGAGTQLAVQLMATRHQVARFTPDPVPRLAGLARVTLETGPWAVQAGWRHRSSLAGAPSRHWIDVGIERQLTQRVRLVASLANAGDAGSAAGPFGRQALLQLVAGF
jgi:hypothetical protein